jgi:hypothetical protein
MVSNHHTWRFFRAGGFDQARIDTGADLKNLGILDQKLWVALSCPVKGVHFDMRTLALVDTDGDGHVRAREIIGAAEWACARLKSTDTLVAGQDELLLSAIDDGSEEGRRVLASAREILKNLGKPDATLITVAEAEDSGKVFAQARFNGDGIVTAACTDDPALKQAIADIVSCLGGETDRSGEMGVSEDLITRFFDEASAWRAWQQRRESDPGLMPLGEHTEAALATLSELRPKIEDFFTRCRLAAFDPRAANVLSGQEADYLAYAGRDLNDARPELAARPLAVAEAGRHLPLDVGVNPAWAEAMKIFREKLVRPLMGEFAALSEEQWHGLLDRLAPCMAWLADKVDTPVAGLGLAGIDPLLAGNAKAALLDLVQQDKALADEFDAVGEVERLARYCRDLHLLVNNFVSFRDFYTGKGKAIFQAGTLYLDGRSCELTIRVEDPNKHAVLANLSRVCLVYCECVRGAEKMHIAAAFTAGDSDQLMVGRNGVFYDRDGRDWDATITKIVEHPISIRQAFWGPYKRIGKMVGEQLQKFAANKAKEAEDKAAATAIESGKKAGEGKPPAQQAFDVGKFAGIFAAIGLALGAIGTAIASVLTGFISLKWWQMPLAIFGLMLLISGPAMIIAAFKLHQRNLGPLLDANGWAVNARARINLPFGATLTGLAILPEGAERSLTDPYAERKHPVGFYLFLLALLLVLLFFWTRSASGL